MKCRYETPVSQRCLRTAEIVPCWGYDNCNQFQPDYKTNADHIRAMSNQELAERNVQDALEYTVDYDWDENPIREYVPCFKTSDGTVFYDYEDAVEHELRWLKQPCKEDT